MNPQDLKPIEQAKEHVIENFDLLDNWQQRYAYLIELGSKTMAKNEHIKTDSNRLYGCQASVWLTSSVNKKIITFKGTSDSVIVAGLIALLLKVYSNQHAQDILNTPPDFIERTGLLNNLTSQRGTGLMLMIEKMVDVAKQHLH